MLARPFPYQVLQAPIVATTASKSTARIPAETEKDSYIVEVAALSWPQRHLELWFYYQLVSPPLDTNVVGILSTYYESDF